MVADIWVFTQGNGVTTFLARQTGMSRRPHVLLLHVQPEGFAWHYLLALDVSRDLFQRHYRTWEPLSGVKKTVALLYFFVKDA